MNHSFRIISSTLFSLLLSGYACAAEEDSIDMGELFADGRHRIDLSYTHNEGFDRDVNLTLPAYTYSFSRQFRVAAAVSYVELYVPSNEANGISEDVKESGWGDSIIGFQYDPNGKLGSGLWVPDTLGLYGNLLMPTGNKSQGLTGDAWVPELGGGWLLDMPGNFWIIPTTSYRKSYKEGDGADGVNEAGIGVGFYWLFPHRTWLGIEPRYGWDFERNSEISQFQMHIGKAFANGLAVEASWGSQDRVDRGALRDDKLLVLSLSWQFGSPPD